MHGKVPRHLDFSLRNIPWPCDWGQRRGELAHCAKLGEQWGYDEINLNCGCPSERVQRGAFGACLMAEPQLVADCVKAMVDAVDVPVTVKHRVGIDKAKAANSCSTLSARSAVPAAAPSCIHAGRNAWAQGPVAQENC